jgi:primosomal protein N'
LAKFVEERRDFAYPPFARFVALGTTGKSAQEANKKSEHLAKALSPLLTKDCRLYPTKSVDRPKKRGQFESTTLLRFRETLPPDIRTFLEKNSKDLIIDIDPLALR